MLLAHSDRAQDLEAAKVRAQKNAAFTAVDLAMEKFPAVQRQLEICEFAFEQINAV